uniref:Uncharacterized protein n=1 Tax=Salix viminalis TaxID=40686 RepID=A0A6N2K8Q6_SALVM
MSEVPWYFMSAG